MSDFKAAPNSNYIGEMTTLLTLGELKTFPRPLAVFKGLPLREEEPGEGWEGEMEGKGIEREGERREGGKEREKGESVKARARKVASPRLTAAVRPKSRRLESQTAGLNPCGLARSMAAYDAGFGVYSSCLITCYAIVLMSEVTAAERLNSSTTGSL